MTGALGSVQPYSTPVQGENDALRLLQSPLRKVYQPDTTPVGPMPQCSLLESPGDATLPYEPPGMHSPHPCDRPGTFFPHQREQQGMLFPPPQRVSPPSKLSFQHASNLLLPIKQHQHSRHLSPKQAYRPPPNMQCAADPHDYHGVESVLYCVHSSQQPKCQDRQRSLHPSTFLSGQLRVDHQPRSPLVRSPSAIEHAPPSPPPQGLNSNATTHCANTASGHLSFRPDTHDNSDCKPELRSHIESDLHKVSYSSPDSSARAINGTNNGPDFSAHASQASLSPGKLRQRQVPPLKHKQVEARRGSPLTPTRSTRDTQRLPPPWNLLSGTCDNSSRAVACTPPVLGWPIKHGTCLNGESAEINCSNIMDLYNLNSNSIPDDAHGSAANKASGISMDSHANNINFSAGGKDGAGFLSTHTGSCGAFAEGLADPEAAPPSVWVSADPASGDLACSAPNWSYMSVQAAASPFTLHSNLPQQQQPDLATPAPALQHQQQQQQHGMAKLLPQQQGINNSTAATPASGSFKSPPFRRRSNLFAPSQFTARKKLRFDSSSEPTAGMAWLGSTRRYEGSAGQPSDSSHLHASVASRLGHAHEGMGGPHVTHTAAAVAGVQHQDRAGEAEYTPLNARQRTQGVGCSSARAAPHSAGWGSRSMHSRQLRKSLSRLEEAAGSGQEECKGEFMEQKEAQLAWGRSLLHQLEEEGSVQDNARLEGSGVRTHKHTGQDLRDAHKYAVEAALPAVVFGDECSKDEKGAMFNGGMVDNDDGAPPALPFSLLRTRPFFSLASASPARTTGAAPCASKAYQLQGAGVRWFAGVNSEQRAAPGRNHQKIEAEKFEEGKDALIERGKGREQLNLSSPSQASLLGSFYGCTGKGI